MVRRRVAAGNPCFVPVREAAITNAKPSILSTRPVAVVTGASAGVGRATAQAFARAGYDVALLARGDAGLRAAEDDVRREGARSVAIAVDVAQFGQVHDAAATIESSLGPIDVWVNNAMTTVFQYVADTRPEDFERAVSVTFLGQVWGTMSALELMRPRDTGTIVNVGSALAFVGLPLQAPYCAAKFACRGFFESLRAELLHEGSSIRLRMVHLPAVNTPQFDWCQSDQHYLPQPVPPIYEPDLVASRIVRAVRGGPPQRVVGSWNRLVVAMARAVPDVAVHFSAATGVKSQLTNTPMPSDRPTNLCSPQDATIDYGAHGRFDRRAHGVLDASFLRSVPRSVLDLAAAARATWRDRHNDV